MLETTLGYLRYTHQGLEGAVNASASGSCPVPDGVIEGRLTRWEKAFGPRTSVLFTVAYAGMTTIEFLIAEMCKSSFESVVCTRKWSEVDSKHSERQACFYD